MIKWLDFVLKVRAKKIPKNGNNSYLKFKYYMLSDIEKAIYETIEETGYEFELLSIVIEDNKFVCTYRCDDVFKEFEYFGDTAQTNKIQAAGSSSTYAHRYSLMRMLGLSDESDDPDYDRVTSKKKILKKEITTLKSKVGDSAKVVNNIKLPDLRTTKEEVSVGNELYMESPKILANDFKAKSPTDSSQKTKIGTLDFSQFKK